MKLVIPEPKLWYVYSDEKFFFAWLESIGTVTRVTGSKRGLELTLATPVSDDDLADLIGLMKRYRLDMKCLQKLCTTENRHWFKKSNKYWYRSVWGK